MLKKHWPNVPNLGDIKEVDWNGIEKPDMLTGGFPCQDISVAGKGAGIKEGTRSGLWKEYARAIGILRPKIALIENVPMLAKRGLNIVLSDLASLGYDAEWNIISAASVGALHKRERLFIIAYPNHGYEQDKQISAGGKTSSLCAAPNPDGERCDNWPYHRQGGHFHENEKWEVSEAFKEREELQPVISEDAKAANINGRGLERYFKGQIPRSPSFSWCENVRRIEDLQGRPYIPEPLIRREDYGLPARVHRIKCLGNAVIPQVAEAIGKMILQV